MCFKDFKVSQFSMGNTFKCGKSQNRYIYMYIYI